MSSHLNWGIIGTGNIAGQFAAGVAGAQRGSIRAVASRSQASAAAFAQKWQIATAHSSYDALLANRDVEAIYLSLPNSMHHEWAIKALRAGKHVLCEKPFATNAADAEEMFDVAQHQGRVIVEAFMYVSHPQTAAVLKTIQEGAIGTVRLIRTGFCYRTNKIDGNIRFSRELAGGALMDVGCYCLSFARLISGEEPRDIFAVSNLLPSGVDEMTAGTLRFPSGIAATFSCGMRVQADNTAYICGTEGYLEIPWPWKPQLQATFTIAKNIPPRQDGGVVGSEQPRRTITVSADRPLYALEADEFAAAVLDGAKPAVSRAATIGNMKLLDAIRSQVGIGFSGDR
ncbi:MAG: Gfo/Idh/MocA family oxidoreductase [Phycisphaerae bacterium]|nr:Gfo/Idh/MocA family oxidoreductase [Phycisphaerae bacterium]